MKLTVRFAPARSLVLYACRPAVRRVYCAADHTRPASTTTNEVEPRPSTTTTTTTTTTTENASQDATPRDAIASKQPIGIGMRKTPTGLQKKLTQDSYLPGQKAVITGGSRGIGWSIAYRLALEGVTCTLVGRDEATLKQAVEALPYPHTLARQNSSPDGKDEEVPTHSYVVGNVTDSTLWGSLFMRTTDVHVLVNAAGIMQTSVLPRSTPSEIHDILDVNLYGTILGCRAALRAWLKTGNTPRCIVNISSLLAIRGGYGASAYAASKAGVIGLTRAIAEEGSGRNIRANVILPGYIQTDMIANLPKRQLEEIKGRIPTRRIGTPDDVADAAQFLIKNTYANNCVLNLDGGLSAAL